MTLSIRETKPATSPRERARMVTILPQMENVHLHKDVGKVPYHLAVRHGCDAEIWAYRNGEYPDWPPELGVRFFRRTSTRLGHYARFLRAIATEAPRIPVLMLFHIKLQSLLFGWIYKKRNPNGRLYVKADVDARVRRLLDSRLRRAAVRRLIDTCDLVSFESEEMWRLFDERFPAHRDRFLHLPNGFDPPSPDTPEVPKENLMIAVGRLDAEQKAIPNLLQALGRLESKLGDWRVELVGPFVGIADEIAAFRSRHPGLEERVVFTGPIWNERKLDETYRRARVLLLPSWWEGFPLILPQAAHRGCVVVGHDVGGVRDITENGRFGRISPVGDIDALTEDIAWCVKHPEEVDRRSREQLRRSDRFLWAPIIDRLAARLGRA